MSALASDDLEILGDLEYEYRLIWEAELAIDQKDPFFFDHPLDHVPAMLLIEGALRMAESAATAVVGSPRRRHIGGVSLQFQRFCELTSPPIVRVWAADGAPGWWCVEFVQNGQVIGKGDLEWRGGTGESTASHEGPAVPVPADLVHRSRPQNVLLGGFEELGPDDYRTEVLTPAPSHYFRRRSPRVRTLGELIEAIRQFGTLLGHEAREVALGRQFIVKSLDVDLERTVSRAERVTLHSRGLPEARGRGAGTMSFAIQAGEHPIGEASFTGHAVSAEAYRRIRRMR